MGKHMNGLSPTLGRRRDAGFGGIPPLDRARPASFSFLAAEFSFSDLVVPSPVVLLAFVMKLLSLRGGRASSISSPRPSVNPKLGSKDTPLEVEAGRPLKRTKIIASEGAEAVPVRPRVVAAKRVECAEAGPLRGVAGPSWEATEKDPRPPTVRDLCRLPAGTDEPFWSLVMGELPTGEASDPLVAY
ncbi:hypothetical protein C4D60_Mb08t10640 [Musa balbisiana]|uniref:Uncharacterized protein n=1 Tax=Musa balbisiana TaxID=52838 RepID=A0A4S8K2U0_MUSBA|nr:hypothetical protein C4D60_Mb08t10640 [Musa balbisiana]